MCQGDFRILFGVFDGMYAYLHVCFVHSRHTLHIMKINNFKNPLQVGFPEGWNWAGWKLLKIKSCKFHHSIDKYAIRGTSCNYDWGKESKEDFFPFQWGTLSLPIMAVKVSSYWCWLMAQALKAINSSAALMVHIYNNRRYEFFSLKWVTQSSETFLFQHLCPAEVALSATQPTAAFIPIFTEPGMSSEATKEAFSGSAYILMQD